eukprot:3527277-Rhodomonas_salina.1
MSAMFLCLVVVGCGGDAGGERSRGEKQRAFVKRRPYLDAGNNPPTFCKSLWISRTPAKIALGK